MALIKCPACSNEVSSAAAACPKCGHPLKPQKKTSGCAVVIAIVFGLLLLSALVPNKDNAPSGGQRQAQYDENLVMVSACHEAQRRVKSRLKAPASAEFPGCVLGLGEYRFNIVRVGREVEVDGYVDAQNSFGAKLRQRFRVRLHSSSDLADPNWDRADVTLFE